MQTLFYNQVSQSLTLVKDNTDTSTPYYWTGITSLIISASAYDTIDSGSSGFGTTVGDIRISAYSGSILVATFPTETTNIYYVSSPEYPSDIIILPSSSVTYATLNYNFVTTVTNPGLLSQSGAEVYGLTETASYLDLFGENGNGVLSLISNYSYSLEATSSTSGSATYKSYLWLYDITSGSTLLFYGNGADLPVSTSFVPSSFGRYSASFVITP